MRLFDELRRLDHAAGLAVGRRAHKEVEGGVLPPWWRLSHTVRQGAILALLFGALALAAWSLQARRPDGWVLSVAVTTSLSALAFASQTWGLRSLRQARRRGEGERR